ncbi:MAG: TIGR03936 family radical SAM-associated protein [Acidobacteriia bacterium]|nr:TIGR03936 family radical SAM-associated protein [Terriglobia bacterium]
MSSISTLDQFLSQVEKPVRYMGGEWNQVVKDHAAVDVTMALCFPDLYEIGMSHMGVRILYSLLNKRPEVALERCFTPWIDLIDQMRARGVPLCSLETHTPLRQFDLIGFSLQYEMSFTNILVMLDLAGIPLRSGDRDLSFPLVLAGGPVAMAPEPIGDFIDAFVIGDGEETLNTLIDRVKCWKREGDGLTAHADKTGLLRELAKIPGVYVPALYDVVEHPLHGLQVVVPRENGEPVHVSSGGDARFWNPRSRDSAPQNAAAPPFPITRCYVNNISDYPFPSDLIVPFGEIVHDRISVEIARGCLDGCRFCQAGYTYRPLRERSIDDIVNTIVRASEQTGFDEATIASLSTADYSCLNPLLEKLMNELERRKIALSLTSMRADSITPEVTSQMKRVRKTGLTIAPEAGTQRMRDIINKNITEESVLKSVATAFEAGWDLIKLYFMIGLPMETEADVRGIFELGKKVRDLSKHSKRSVNVNLSASSFIPKSHTPFQWFGFCDLEEIKEKQRLLRSLCKPARINFKHHHPETSQMECVLSRGDRRLGRVLERAFQMGCRFDGWDDQFQYAKWLEAFEQEGIDYRQYLKPLPVFDSPEWRQSSEIERRDGAAYIRALSSVKIKPLEAQVDWTPLPWDHLDNRVDKKFIVWDLKRSLQARVSPTCGPDLCYNCGLECDFGGVGPGVLASQESKGGETGDGDGRKQVSSVAGEAPPLLNAPSDFGNRNRYRAMFSKLGRSKFLSHLDLMRLVQRAFRRAGIPLRYTQGFHPQPVVAFGPALSVGIEGAAEIVDFEAGILLEEVEFLSVINSVLPDGVRFSRLRPMEWNAPSATAIVKAARYSVDLQLNRVAGAGDSGDGNQGAWDAESVERRLNDFRAAEHFIIQRQKKDRTVATDLRSFVRRVELISGDTESGCLRIELDIEMGERGSVKPQEVLKSILNISDENFHAIQRHALFAERNGTYIPAFSS